MKDIDNYDYLRGFIDGHVPDPLEPEDYPEGLGSYDEVLGRMLELEPKEEPRDIIVGLEAIDEESRRSLESKSYVPDKLMIPNFLPSMIGAGKVLARFFIPFVEFCEQTAYETHWVDLQVTLKNRNLWEIL